jgi:hypothetical protein
MALVVIKPADQAAKPISTAEDVARSAGAGAVEGAVSVPGVLGDVRGAGEAAANFLAQKLGLQGSPAKLGQLPVAGLQIPDAAGVLRAAGAQLAQKAGVDPRMARMVMALTTPGGLASMPTSAELQGVVTHNTPLYQSQTAPGRYARTVAAFAPAAVAGPGTAVQRIARTVVPAVASQAAGNLPGIKGTKAEPYARMAAAITGAGVAQLGTGGGAREKLLADASRGATDAQVAEARDLMNTAQKNGVQLTMSEALQQVTNGATGMSRLQRVVEGTPKGSEVIRPIMAQRPAQMQQSVADFADAIGPATDQPSMIGGAAQESATRAIDGVRQGINQERVTAHLYDQLPKATIPQAQIQKLLSDPAYLQAEQNVRADPVIGPTLEHLPSESAAVIQKVVQQLNAYAEGAKPAVMNPGGNVYKSALYSQAAANADQTLKDFVPAYQWANERVAAGRAANLEPLQRGPLGAIAGSDDVGAQTKALFPNQPLEGAPAETAKAVSMMGGSVSDVAKALVRQHIVNTANEAMQANSGGPNQWGGAKWAAMVAGNPEQARVLDAGVGAAGGDTSKLSDLLDVLRATGRREGPGSQTAFNTKAMEQLGNAGAGGEVLRTGLDLPGAFRRMGLAVQDWQQERNAENLAKAIIANPDQAEQILMHARAVVPEGVGRQAIARAALAAQLARRSASDRPPALTGP